MTPARQPLESRGVSTSPPTTTKTLLPVHSESRPVVSASTASDAPRRCASARATAFSAYDVVFSPAMADRSLRTHGTVASVVVAGHGAAGVRVTTRVGAPVPALAAERADARRSR